VNRPALSRAAAVPFVAAPLMASLLLMAPVAQALPAPPHGPPAHAAAPRNDDAGDPDHPVRITVGRFEPRTVTPQATISVAGTLENTGDQPISDIRVRLQRGEVRTTRAELASAVRDADPATTVVPPFQPVRGGLAPGESLEFSYSLPAAELHMDRDGVYPVVLNVNGTALSPSGTPGDDERRRVGELATFVVRQQVTPAAHTTAAWLWPITERSHRTAAGTFADDGLADSIAGGRLDRALTVIERLPSTTTPGSSDTVPALPVTLAVDPALVEELTVMADGPYPVGGTDSAGTGTDAARAFLDRLRAVADVHPVVALPYGDVDADALMAAGLEPELTRTLPGTAAGTAQAPPSTGGNPSPATNTSPAGGTGTAGPGTTPPRTGASAGVDILKNALDVEPRSDLAWPAGGSLRADTLATLQAGGMSQVVLTTDGLTDGDRAVGLPNGRAGARSSVSTAAGPLEVLVADPTLSTIAGSAEQAPGGPRMAEQRYLAELAVLSLQAPRGSEQTVLVAPPRAVDAGPDGAGAMMADTAGLPWLRAGSLDGLTRGPSAPAGSLADPVDAVQLDATGLGTIAEGMAARDDLAGAVVGDPDAALEATDAAAARASSVAWRGDPSGFRAAAEDFRASVDRLRGRVTLLAPADGTYSLAASDSPLVLTVHNDLPFAVQVRLDLHTRGNRGLSIADIGTQTLAPHERTTLQVPTQVRQSGGFAVTAALTTPSGGALGDPVQMDVKSTAYGPISLLITIGSAALLGLLFLRRLVRFLLRRRRAANQSPPDDGVPAIGPEGALVPRPPTRSPV
jgi:hypothetical protein